MFDIFLFLASILIIAKGASWFSDSSVKLAFLIHLPQAVVGATVVSIATTAPETIVSLFSSLSGHSGFALGNVLGSPVANIGFAFSFLLLFSRVSFDRRLFYHIAILVGVILFLGVILFFRRVVDFYVALPLFVFAFSFLTGEILQMKRGLNSYFEEFWEDRSAIYIIGRFFHLFKLLFFFLLGLALILIGGTVLVQTGTKLALLLGVGELFIGLTFFAVGTSLPEIVLAVTTIWKKTSRISSGNLFGASILTLTWVLAIAAIFGKIYVSSQVLLFDLPAILIFVLIVLLGFYNKISKRALGVLLLACYIFYIILLKNV